MNFKNKIQRKVMNTFFLLSCCDFISSFFKICIDNFCTKLRIEIFNFVVLE